MEGPSGHEDIQKPGSRGEIGEWVDTCRVLLSSDSTSAILMDVSSWQQGLVNKPHLDWIRERSFPETWQLPRQAVAEKNSPSRLPFELSSLVFTFYIMRERGCGRSFRFHKIPLRQQREVIELESSE